MTNIDQSNANAGGHLVAGNLQISETHNHQAPERRLGVVEQLLNRLQCEMEQDNEVRKRVESLQYFYERRSHDGIDGLENKLAKGNRANELATALDKKEQFVKLLDKWSMYASAQEIFAFLLAKIDHIYDVYILPEIETLDQTSVNKLISTQIIDPTVAECGGGVFTLNHVHAYGMFYWLAEQCFVRWHK